MDSEYYEVIDKMEKEAVDREYINGWACGYLHTPKREEQRINERYEAGYADGWDRKSDGYLSWVKSSQA